MTSSKEGFFPAGMTQEQKVLMGGILFFFLAFCYMLIQAFLGHVIKLPEIPGGLYGRLFIQCSVPFLFFVYTRGWKFALTVTGFLFVYCWLIEECSIHTGFPFGNYYYSDQMGFKLDVAPITLGFRYFWAFVFPAYFVANLIVEGRFLGLPKNWGSLLFVGFIASILIAGVDMAADPLEATKLSAWVWTKNNYTGYYGIPYMNYLGYLITMTPAFLLFGWLEKKFNAQPLGPITMSIALIPLLFYFLVFVILALPAPSGVFLVACFTMIFPLLLAIDKLKKNY